MCLMCKLVKIFQLEFVLNNRKDKRFAKLYLAAFAGFLVPGGAHIVLGKTLKGFIFVVVILAAFFAGLIITDNYAFTQQSELRHPVMYWLQYLVGSPAIISAQMKPAVVVSESFTYPKMFEIGILYIAIAGLLNLLIYIDGIALAISPKTKPKKLIHKKADDSPPIPES